MLFLFPHQRDWECSRLVYKEGASAEVSVGKNKEAGTLLPEVKFDPTKKTENEQWAAIDEKYGKTAYEAIISAHVDKLMPTASGDYKSVLLRDSMSRYMPFYNYIKGVFMRTAVDLKQKFNYSVERVQEKTQSELAVLRSAVEGSRPLIRFTEAMPAPENKDAVMSHFSRYLEALKGRYFAEYRNESESFQNKMQGWVDAKLTWLLNQSGTKASDLESFKAEIASRYEQYSKIDRNPSIISGADLAALEAAAKPNQEAMLVMLREDDDRLLSRLEVFQLLNPDAWSNSVEIIGDEIIRAAVNNGSEQEFIAEVRKYKKVKNFGEAKSEFREMLGELAKVGVRETMDFLKKFNLGAHGDVLQYEESIDPPALTLQVHKQLDYLLSGTLVPKRDEDRMLVRFMTADRDGRNDILSHDGTRDILFRGIKMATADGQYEAVYRKLFGRIPTEAKKLKRSARIADPTRDDQAAQLQALMILGHQAKVIVSKLERTPEHAGKHYVDEIEAAQVPEDTSAVMIGLKFQPPGGGKARFRSALDRGGFNTHSLATKGAKLLGLVVAASNLAQSYSETHGDFMERILDTAGRAATNQGFLIGAGLTVGAHMVERNKAFLRYPWLSPYERNGAMITFKLDNLAARVGHKEMNRFLFNNAEWRALSDMAMTPKQIKEMLAESSKRTASGSYPTITIADMRKVIGEKESILSTLTTGGKSARMRYLFYEKFFSGSTKPDVNEVKKHCTGSSSISTSSVLPEKS